MMENDWQQNFFFIDSEHLEDVQTYLYGYGFLGSGLLDMKSIENIMVSENLTDIGSLLDGNGAYDYVERKGDRIRIRQDFIGCLGIYLYENEDYFAMSNSLLMLIEKVKAKHKLTLNKNYASHLLAIDLGSIASTSTIMNEIQFIGRDELVDIDIPTKKISFSKIDYKENRILLDSREGLSILDKWYDKWTEIIRGLQSHTTNLCVDLSGGFDSRMSFLLVLGSGIDMNKIFVNSIKDTLHTHKEDYEIATQIAEAFGFKLNNNTQIKAPKRPLSMAEIYEHSFYSKLFEHKQMYFCPNNAENEIFFISGAGGESVRSSHWNIDGKELTEEHVAACRRFFSKPCRKGAEDGMRLIFEEALAVGLDEDLTSNERSMLFYRNTRCRYHFGKDKIENYLHGRIKVTPLLDPLLQSIKLTTDECNDMNLLPAVIFSRYIPKLKEFPFDGGRKIDDATWEYAEKLNTLFPYIRQDSMVEYANKKECFHEENKRFEPENSNIENAQKKLPVWYEQKDLLAYMQYLLSYEDVKKSFAEVYDEETFEIIRDDIEKRKYHPYSYGYAAFAIALANHYAATSGTGDTRTLIDFFEEHAYENIISPYSVAEYRNLIDLSKSNKFRIDIRNEGGEDNDLQICEKKRASEYEYSMKITSPKWFSWNGTGYVVTFDSRRLDLQMTCVNDGKLVVALKGADVRDTAGKRRRCYVRVLDVLVNGEKQTEKPVLVWHDEPLKIEKTVKDGDEVNVSVLLEHL